MDFVTSGLICQLGVLLVTLRRGIEDAAKAKKAAKVNHMPEKYIGSIGREVE